MRRAFHLDDEPLLSFHVDDDGIWHCASPASSREACLRQIDRARSEQLLRILLDNAFDLGFVDEVGPDKLLSGADEHNLSLSRWWRLISCAVFEVRHEQGGNADVAQTAPLALRPITTLARPSGRPAGAARASTACGSWRPPLRPLLTGD